MSASKNPKPRKKLEKKGHEAQNVGSKHKEDVDKSQTPHQPKTTAGLKEIINNNIPSTKKNTFTIPRKKTEPKELLQSVHFDSRETKELLRSVQLSLRDPNFWSSFKFERVEFINNEKLGRKYGEKKQALRLETMRTNRELEDKFAFLYTTSRNEVKLICEHGLHTGNSSLKSLGDPKLGVYLCRFADIIFKRPLTTDDAGYLLVFRVVKGKVRFIGGSNPELQPTPHHDCHVSKSLTTLSSKASHSDVFESSQFYFYEIDENSDDFHVKHPRQVLPYAVLTFSILRPQRQQTKFDEKSEGKKAVVTGHEILSSADENVLFSPNRIDLISDANVSWSGVLAINKKQFAYVDFLSYSRKKHPLPINVDHFDISRKVSHDDLRSLLKFPIFSNGKPAASGVCIELSHGRKFIYYEVRVVNQIQEKFDEVLSLLVENEMAAVIECCYFKGPIYLYLIPTSKLTNDIGITDRKSPLALHALVQVRHFRRLPCSQDTMPNEQEKEQDAGINDTALNEAVIKSKLQEILKKKYARKEKKETQHGKTKQDKKISPLMSRRISLEEGENTTDNPSRKSTEVKLILPPDGAPHEKYLQYQKDAQEWVDNFFSSARKERAPNVLDNNESLKTSRKEKENFPSKNTSKGDQGMDVEPASSTQPEDTNVSSVDKVAASSLPSENKQFEIDFPSVQKLIREFKQQDKQEKSTLVTKSSALIDPRLQRSIPPLVLPPIPPPPPPPVSPFSSAILSLPIGVANTPVAKTTTSEQSSVTGVPLATSPVSPPAVKRQEVLIPGFEPTGSPVFQLMKEKVSFMDQSICTSDTYLKNSLISTKSVMTWNQIHPSSPIIASSSTENTPRRTTSNITNTPVVSSSKPCSTANEKRENDQEVQTSSFSRDSPPKVVLSPPVINDNQSQEKCTAQSDLLDSDIPSYDDIVINRPLTQAEKKSSRAIWEIKNILLRNMDVSKKASAEDDDDDDNHAGYKSEVSGTAGMESETGLKQIEEVKILSKDRLGKAECGSRKSKEYSKKESIVKEYVVKGKRSAAVDWNVDEDEGNVDERNVGHKQPMKNLLNTGVIIPDKFSSKSDSLTSSPQTPELKNGLELLDDLISCSKRGHHPFPLSKSEPRRHQTDPKLSRNSGKRSKSHSREMTPRKEKPDEERKKTSPTRKRKVSIKRSKNTVANEKNWDDMTSDISDTELPLDSDECLSEKQKNSDGDRNRSSPRSKDSSRLSSHDGYDCYTKERRTVRIGLKRDSRDTHGGYRDDHEDLDRKWKRRKLDKDQEPEIPELSSPHDNESTHSDSAMSISSLDSVSFEYAIPNDEECPYNKYRFVRTSPMNGGSLEVTIRRDIEPPDTFSSQTNPDDYGTDPYHTRVIPPSSSEDIEMTASSVIPDSPGTPETAVPCEDFLHTYVGYWSTGSTLKESSVRETKDINDKCFKPKQQETTHDTTCGNEGTWSTPPSPYHGCSDDRDITAARYKNKEPVVKKSRGEGCQRECSSSGANTGYDYNNTSYMDRNQHTNPDYCRPMEHDSHPLDRASNNYDSSRDLSDTYKDRYLPKTDCYDDQEDLSLYYDYASRSPYEDIDSPQNIGCVEELGSNERYYSTDRIDIYSNSDRHDSPLNIGERSGQYSEHRGNIYNDYGRRSPTPEGREVNNNDYRWRRTSTRDDRRSPTPEGRGINNDDYGWRQTIPNDDLKSPILEGRGIDNEDNRWKGTISSNDPPSHYSPERNESINDRYRRRSPLVKNNKTSEYSPKRSRTIGDEYRRSSCSPHVSNNRHSQYPFWKGVSDDSYVQRSSLENTKNLPYSPEGVHGDSYRQRSPTYAERQSYSPEEKGIRDEQRMHIVRCLYSPDPRGDTNDGYRQRSSLENNERSSQYSPDWRGLADDTYRLRSPSTADGRCSFFSTYKRGISDDKYARISPSLDDINDSNSCYSPERTPAKADEYGNYKMSGKDIESGREYRQDYQNDQEFPPGIDAYQDEEPQGCFSEDEDNEVDLQSSYTYDVVEPNHGSDGADTPEYYDKEQHKYLDDIAKNTISATTLALDHAVFDCIKEYPVQLLELAKCLNVISKRSSDGEGFLNEDGTDSSGISMVASQDHQLYKDLSNDGSADRLVTEPKKKKKSGDHRKVFKPFPRKYFYIYNPDKDSECEAVKHYMLKTGAQYLDVSDEDNLKTMSGELRVLIRRKNKQSVHRISNLFKLKLCPTVKFALFNTVEDVSKKTKAYAAIFQYGGVLIPDDAILRTADPALLEALLAFMAEQNAIHQKFFWVMNIRYIAYKKLGSQRPLTWRDAFVLDLLRKYRNERFVNIINKDYVLENLSTVQRCLDTALKQQLELMPTYRHFLLLSDLNKQVVEVSWFFNRGIGFMDLKEWLHLFAGKTKTQQLLSTSKYMKDGSEFTSEGTIHDTLQYDTIDSPEDEESIEPSSMSATTTKYMRPLHEGRHLSRSLSCNMVSRSTNYNDDSDIKEKRLEILSSINSIKTNLRSNMGPNAGNSKFTESVGKQQQYERSRSHEPYLQEHNDRTIPRWANNHQKCDNTKSLDRNGLPEFKEAQYSKALYEKQTGYHGNGRGTLSGTFN